MSRANLSVVGWVVLASLMLVLGLTAWLAGASPFRTAQAAGLIDDSFADFAAGTGCYVRASGAGGLEGEVVMSLDTDFPGSVLPAGWYESPAAVATVSGGVLSIDEGTAGTSATFAPNQTLEFTATFGTANFQHGGFGVGNFGPTPYAIFSTNGTTLRARTDGGSGETLTDLPGYLGSPHRYRIEWGTTNVIYSIDGGAVATHSIAIAGSMAVLFQDFNISGTTFDIDRVRLWALASPCAYESRAIDSTYAGFNFTGISTTLSTPAGTSIAFEARTSSDGIGWGSWVPVNGNGTFNAGMGRYLQYRATLSTADPQISPEVLLVQAHGTTPSAVRLDSFSARPMDDAGQSWLIALIGFVLILGAGWLIGQRRRRFD